MDPDFADIQLNDHQRLLLASAADHLGVPWSEVFEQAIAPLAEPIPQSPPLNGKTETPYEIFERLGLIGCIKGTPSDLSTNKKYMQGYGKHG